MKYFEIINSISQIVIAVFTIVLAYATWILGRHTKAMNAHEKEEKNVRELQQCIFLGESIIVIFSSEIISLKIINLLNELLTLSKHFHDTDTKRQFEQIVYQYQLALVEHEGEYPSDNLMELFNKIRPRLTQEIIEWQKDLGNYGGIRNSK